MWIQTISKRNPPALSRVPYGNKYFFCGIRSKRNPTNGLPSAITNLNTIESAQRIPCTYTIFTPIKLQSIQLNFLLGVIYTTAFFYSKNFPLPKVRQEMILKKQLRFVEHGKKQKYTDRLCGVFSAFLHYSVYERTTRWSLRTHTLFNRCLFAVEWEVNLKNFRNLLVKSPTEPVYLPSKFASYHFSHSSRTPR